MKRVTAVARTADDLDHLNRLVLPEFGVLWLCLVLGDKASESYRPDHAPEPEADEIPKKPEKAKRSDNFHFAPSKEKPKIAYQLDDRFAAASEAKLELFRRGEAKAIWERKLEPEEMTDGVHEIEWDGKITKSKEFPEELITVEHSPYKLKLSLEGEGVSGSLEAWTYLHVLLHDEADFELGPEEALSEQRDKDLRTELGSLPKKDDADEKPVHLVSNDFSTGGDKADSTLFDRYKDIWEDGPNIPVLLKPYIRSSTDKKEDVPKAIGKVRFLWEWEDVAQDTSGVHAKGKAYLDLALDCEKTKTGPKGVSCHKDRGGKRGDTSKLVFPAEAGYEPADTLTAGSFPFKVEAAKTRKWCSYSESWNTGKLVGKAGARFQPSRMAGDGYQVHVYFAHHRKPDGTDDLDTTDDKKLKHAIKWSTGKFRIWREVHIVNYAQKDSGLTAIPMNVADKYYHPTFVRIVDKSGGKTTISSWNTTVRAKVNALPDWKKWAVKDGDQGTITKAALRFRSFTAYKTKVKSEKGFTTDAQVTTFLRPKRADTAARYNDLCENVSDNSVPAAVDGLIKANGVSIVQFTPYWEADGGSKSSTLGFASTDFPSVAHDRALYLEVGDYSSFTINGQDKTFGHEVGHNLYLPHAFNAGGYVASLHDEHSHWLYCLMSYNDAAENHFCGLCMLRLRGWDESKLDSDRTKNQKT